MRRPPQRPSQKLPLRKTLLLVGEGKETEPNYFHALKQELEVRSRYTITVKRGPGSDANVVVQAALQYRDQAKKRGEAFDEVWCVLDVEGPENRPQLRAAIALAEKENLSLCLSNPSFEVWLLAHFERKAQSYLNGAAVVEQLNRHWRPQFGQSYDKGDTKLYSRLKDRQEQAIETAQWVLEKHHQQERSTNANSSTEVYRLVRKLLGRG